MANTAFRKFSEMVLSDTTLQAELAAIEDRDVFLERVVSLGRLHSLEFEITHVTEAMRDARKGWAERWK